MDKLNSVGQMVDFNPTRKISALTVDQPYIITGVKQVKTKFGVKIICELGTFNVFLPDRFTRKPEETIQHLNETPDIALVYRGTRAPMGNFNAANIVEFVVIAPGSEAAIKAEAAALAMLVAIETNAAAAAAAIVAKKNSLLGVNIPGPIASTSAATPVSTTPVPSINQRFKISAVRERQVKKFKSKWREIVIIVDKYSPDADGPSELWVKLIFDNLLTYLETHMHIAANDRIGLEIQSNASPDQPVGISYNKFGNLNSDIIANAIASVVQSNKTFLLEGELVISVATTSIPTGNGSRNRRRAQQLDFSEHCRRKSSIVCVKNADKLCLARALVICMAYQTGDKGRICRLRTEKFQKAEAIALCMRCNVSLENAGGSIEEIRQFQSKLREYKITVYDDACRKGQMVVYEGVDCENGDQKYLDILYSNNHYNPIISILGAFTTSYYCRKCHKGYSNRWAHRCAHMCKRCNHGVHSRPDGESLIQCPVCLRGFDGNACFDNHKNLRIYPRGQTMCDVIKFCAKCRRTYNAERLESPHVCYAIYCKYCKGYFEPDHQCYMRRVTCDETKTPLFMMVFFDLECSQDTPLERGGHTLREHVPVLCVAQQCCSVCLNLPDNDPSFGPHGICNTCGLREYIFRDDPIKEFFDYLTLDRNDIKNIYVIAHNLKSYDGQFLLRYIVDVLKLEPEVIVRGTKIMTMTIYNIRFLDSLNFLPMKLSQMPAALNLPDEMEKGFFPYFFIKDENMSYVGALPPQAAYGCTQMSVKEHVRFMEWYDALKKSNYIFDMQRELVTYCRNDVTILRRACLKFRAIFLANNDVDIFLRSITMASACMYTYRKNYLQCNTIAIVKPRGYRNRDRQSYEATVWLLWEERQRKINIMHAHRGVEKRIFGYRVDGYAETDDGRKIIFEYQGCWFHGCLSCFPNERWAALIGTNGDSIAVRYESTQRKLNILATGGYALVQMWGCEFKELCLQNSELDTFVNSLDIRNMEPLNPRDAFFGGRTEVMSTYHKVDDTADEKILYSDVCSLYPYINKYGRYPVGHPEVFVDDACPAIDSFEGFIKCCVLPPHRLHHPVLPMKLHQRCIFALCRTCAEEMRVEECTHEASERQITGTWVVDEVRLALENGYTVVRVFEVWKFKTVQYDRETRRGGLFADYVNKFLKIKQEASDWPAEFATSDALRAQYIANFERHEGISLDTDKITSNPELQQMAKLQLNSLWGRFGMSDNMMQTTVVASYENLLKYFVDPNVEVKSCIPVNEEVVYINWKQNADSVTSSSATTNVFIAAYTTALARIHLYAYLKRLDTRALYCDTDSVIYTQKHDEWAPATGLYLGDMTDELITYGVGSYIDTFVCTAPKSYAFRVRVNGCGDTFKTVCKAKGITINFANKDIINFDQLVEMVHGYTEPIVLHYPNRFVRTKHWRVASRDEVKTYQAVYLKRRFGCVTSEPYGSNKKIKL